MSDALLITPAAYAKMLAHARKFPTQPLSGLLVGKVLPSAAGIFIQDAVPLTHNAVASLPHPIIEAGVKMVQSHACSQGCTVVGAYFCNERADDNAQLNDLNKRMVSRLAEVVRPATSSSSSSSQASAEGATAAASPAGWSQAPPSQMVALLLDNEVLCSGNAAAVCAKVMQPQRLGGALLFAMWNRDTGAPSAAVPYGPAMLPAAQQAPLWDFEEHLEDAKSRNFLA